MRKMVKVTAKNVRKRLKGLKKIIEKYKKETENLWKNAEYNPEKKLYFYFLKPKHRVKAIIATKISLKKPECSFVLVTQEGKDKRYLNASARNQSMSTDMNQLMKQAVEGLDNANGGGHVAAAGARFMKKDLDKFKKNLLR